MIDIITKKIVKELYLRGFKKITIYTPFTNAHYQWTILTCGDKEEHMIVIEAGTVYYFIKSKVLPELTVSFLLI